MELGAKPKRIIDKNYEIILGHFVTHECIAKACNRNSNDILGGGWWKKEGDKIYFYGTSIKYKSVKKDVLTKALTLTASPYLSDCEAYFSESKDLKDALKDATFVERYHEEIIGEGLNMLLDTDSGKAVDIQCECGEWQGWFPNSNWHCCGCDTSYNPSGQKIQKSHRHNALEGSIINKYLLNHKN